MATLPSTRLADWSADDLALALKAVLEPKLSEKAAEIDGLRSRITALEARLAAAEGRLSK